MSQTSKPDATPNPKTQRFEEIQIRDTKTKKKEHTNNSSTLIDNDCNSICTVYLENSLNEPKLRRLPPHSSTIAILFVVNLVNYIDRFTIAGIF